MRTPGPRPAGWMFVIASTATGCIPQPVSLEVSSTPVDLNAPASRIEATPLRLGSSTGRSEIPFAESAQYARIEELLIARAPMLDVRPTGNGRFSLRVRGRTSLSGNAPPLIVVDGMQFGEGGTEALASLAPREVQRVEVLRDIGETGIYGSRGANGVVLVTTRRRSR
jgi:TonB-dependent SusC/RagA subfamily outer membrane receptor